MVDARGLTIVPGMFDAHCHLTSPGGPIGTAVTDTATVSVTVTGVNHDADTTIHLAEVMAEVPYGLPKHGTVLRDGRRERIEYRENDHCCRNFNRVDEWLRAEGLQAEGVVGHGRARLARSRDVTRVVVGRLENDPLLFLCAPGSGCEECMLARASAA